MTNTGKNLKIKEKVLVTGAGGFIGSHLVEALLAKGYEVVCLVKPGENTRWIKDLDVTLVYGDLSQKDALVEAVKSVSYVYHLAAKMGGADTADYVYAVNYDGSMNLLNACMETGVNLKRFLFVSSLAAVGPTPGTLIFDEETPPSPETPYGASKLKAENDLLALGDKIPCTVVRLPLVYGPRSLRGLYVMFKTVNIGFQLLLGKNETNLGFVTDIVNGMILAAESPASIGQRYFLGEDRIYDSAELMKKIAAALGKRTLKIRIPYFVLYGMTFIVETVADLINAHTPLRRDSLASYLKTNWRFSMKKVTEELGYQTQYPLDEGLKVTADWYKKKGFL